MRVAILLRVLSKVHWLGFKAPITRVFFTWAFALCSLLVLSQAQASWKVIDGGRGPSDPEKSSCVRYLTPDYSIFPMHRRLFQTHVKLSRELKMKSVKIYTDDLDQRVTVEMTFPGPHTYAVSFDVNSAAHQLTLNSADGTLMELVYGQVHKVIFFENEPWPPDDLKHFKQILELATALVIPAVMPKVQDVTLRMNHMTASNLGGGLETNITRELARYTHQLILQQPSLLVHRLPTYQAFANLGFTQFARPPILRPMLDRPNLQELEETEFSDFDFDYDVTLKFQK